MVLHRSQRVWSTPFPTEPIAVPTVSVIDGRSGKLLDAWGDGHFIMPHGLGKTQMVQEYARSKGWKFTYCAPAQFEEMGDLHGIPSMHDPTPDKPNSGDEVTIFAPPEWVPKEKGPGMYATVEKCGG